MPHPDFATPPPRRDFTMSVERAHRYARMLADVQRSLAAAPPAAVPANRPTHALPGSASMTTETREPAGSVPIDEV